MTKKSSKPAAKTKAKQEGSAPAAANPVEMGPAVTNAASDIPGGVSGIVPAPVDTAREEVALTILRDGHDPQVVSLAKDGATVGNALVHAGIENHSDYKFSSPDAKSVGAGTHLKGNMTVTLEPNKKD